MPLPIIIKISIKSEFLRSKDSINQYEKSKYRFFEALTIADYVHTARIVYLYRIRMHMHRL